MTTIKVTCRCGDIDLRPEEVTLLLRPGQNSYMFECLDCRSDVRHPANDKITSVLLAVGVAQKDMTLPITEDEITEFVRRMNEHSEEVRRCQRVQGPSAKSDPGCPSSDE